MRSITSSKQQPPKQPPTIIQHIIQLDKEYDDTLIFLTNRLLNGEISQQRFNDLKSVLDIQSRIEEEDIEREYGYNIETMKQIYNF